MNVNDPRVRALLIVVVFLGLGGYLFYDYLLSPQSQKLGEKRVQLEETLTLIEEAKRLAQPERREAVMGEFAKADTLWKMISGALPEEFDDEVLLEDVGDALRDAGVYLETFKPPLEVGKTPDGALYASTYFFEVTCDYDAFGRFLANVANMQRVLSVSKIAVKANTAPDQETRPLYVSCDVTAYAVATE